jgi:flagellar M-ring protein FliF
MDGTYKTEAQKDGTTRRIYVPRSDEEIRKFEALVKRAMGFSEDRGDQVSVMSMAFSDDSLTEAPGEKNKSDWKEVLRALGDHKKTLLNGFLVILVFLLVVRPLIKSMKKMPLELGTPNPELTAGRVPIGQISESIGMPSRDRVLALSKENPEKAVRVIKGWVSE